MTESLYDANDNLVDDVGHIAGGIINQEQLSRKRAIDNFRNAMMDKLNKNSHKGGWREMSIWALFLRLCDDVEELKEAICTNGFNGSIQDEAVDVANFAMMIYSNIKI